MIKTILRVTPHKRPSIVEILENPYFSKTEEKQEEMTSRSTNTEDSKNKSSTFQYLSESCNPKKMAELQKILEKEQPKEQTGQQKKTYPFYVPKNVQKIGVGVPIPNAEQK